MSTNSEHGGQSVKLRGRVKRHRERYPTPFSKGRVAFVGDGSQRGSRHAGKPGNGTRPELSPPCRVQTESLGESRIGGRVVTEPAASPAMTDERRRKLLRVSPTVEAVWRQHLGLAVICTDCLHGVLHRNPALPDQFKRQWRLTLLEIERRSRCGLCNSRRARVYPWSSGEGTGLDLSTPPKGWR